MDVLSSRTLLRAQDRDRSQNFYRDVLGLHVFREFGDPAEPGLVFFLGGGFLEVTGGGARIEQVSELSLWLQVRDLRAEYERLRVAGATIVREPRREPWGLDEMWIADPDGIAIVLVEVPAEHPMRTDIRSL